MAEQLVDGGDGIQDAAGLLNGFADIQRGRLHEQPVGDPLHTALRRTHREGHHQRGDEMRHRQMGIRDPVHHPVHSKPRGEIQQTEIHQQGETGEDAPDDVWHIEQIARGHAVGEDRIHSEHRQRK